MRTIFMFLALSACSQEAPVEPTAAPEAAEDTASPTWDVPIAAMAWTGSSSWTVETSDEYPPVTCGAGSLAIGFDCDGSNCDNLQLRCQPTTGLTFGSRTWTSYFSEESTSYRTCGGNGFVTGLSCRGGDCDDMSLECTTTNRPGTGCLWSAWFSEEDPTFTVPSGHYIKGMQCSGSRCDNVRAYYCRE